MAHSAELTNYLVSRDYDFSGGANSFSDPTKMAQNQYHWGENVENSGSDIHTRWGFVNLLKFSCGRAQGMALFRPSNTTYPSLYMAISGEIWRSPYPFNTAEKIPDLQFRPDLDFVTFQVAIVANTPSQAVLPYLVLIMQDGVSRPAYTDGNIARHLDPTPNGFYSPFSVGGQETRIGLPMEFVGGRLWVGNGREIFASDIFDPLHFIETTYLAGGGSFQAFDGDIVTCLKRTADAKQLLIGTIGNTTALNAGNTDRASWTNDPDFERLLFPGVGWTGPKCAAEIGGELCWMSNEGARLYNAVGNSIFSARRAISSQEMLKSFENRGPLLSRSCAGAFESYGLWGFPSGDQYNRHIWVLDTSSSNLLTESKPYSWQPIWKGIRPVEIVSGDVGGMNRCFCLEQGRDIPRVWEMFAEKRKDYYLFGGQLQERKIECRIDTKGHTFGELLSFKRNMYADLHLKDVFGQVTVEASFKNEFGCFQAFGNWSVCTEQCVTIEDCLFTRSPEKQARYLKTRRDYGECEEAGSPYRTNVGTFFTYRIQWTGELGIRGAKYFSTQVPEKTKGTCEDGDSECILKACCDAELDYWSSPEESFPYYYSGECFVMEVTDE